MVLFRSRLSVGVRSAAPECCVDVAADSRSRALPVLFRVAEKKVSFSASMRASGMPALRALCLAFLPTVLPFGGLSYLRKPTADQAGLASSLTTGWAGTSSSVYNMPVRARARWGVGLMCQCRTRVHT